MTADEAASFTRFSVQNYVAIKSALSCSCEPYRDVFTLRRWNALGYRVRRGEHGVKISTIVAHEVDDGGEIKVVSRPWTSVVFCRCQVERRQRQ
jgi:antirestriction protein ArdC